MDKKKNNRSRDEIIDDLFDIEPFQEITKDEVKEWYYIDKGEINGSYSEQEILLMYEKGEIKASTEVWKNGMTDWVELEQTDLYTGKPSARKKTKDKGKTSKGTQTAPSDSKETVKKPVEEETPEAAFSWEEAVPKKKSEDKETSVPPALDPKEDMTWQEALFEEEDVSSSEPRIRRRTAVAKKETEELNNSILWILTLVPLLAAGAIYLKSIPLFLVLVVIHIVICVIDANMVIKAGFMEKNAVITSVFLTPVYLIKRARLLKQKTAHIYVWGGFTLLMLILALHLIYTQFQPDTGKTETAVTGDDGGTGVKAGEVTVKRIAEYYFTEPEYNLKEQENGQSLLTLSGTINLEGASKEANLQFRVDKDGSVHFLSMNLDGILQEESVYHQLIEAIK